MDVVEQVGNALSDGAGNMSERELVEANARRGFCKHLLTWSGRGAEYRVLESFVDSNINPRSPGFMHAIPLCRRQVDFGQSAHAHEQPARVSRPKSTRGQGASRAVSSDVNSVFFARSALMQPISRQITHPARVDAERPARVRRDGTPRPRHQRHLRA